MPPTTMRQLQDKGRVQSLDGEAHHHRKAMFLRVLVDTPPTRFIGLFERHWGEAMAEWEKKGEIRLFDAVNMVLR
jgi:fatty-acid peroxygenase